MSLTKPVHVAVAVVKNQFGQILIAKRPELAHQGGLWEFPGGKVEKNETVLTALKRELFEEVGIELKRATPLIRIHHNYDDKTVLLDVWDVDEFTGEAFSKEGQEVLWIKLDAFSKYKFPEANLAIIKAVQLPDQYLITGGFESEKELLLRITSALRKGIKLIQFRAPHLDEKLYFYYAEKIFPLCKKENAVLLLNTSIMDFNKYHADSFSHGIHLTVKEINFLSTNTIEPTLYITTSTHNIKELLQAEQLNIDFVVLSPVKETLSHPDAQSLGWDNFHTLTEQVNMPIYALGGMTRKDINKAKEKGGQGVAAIGEFWNM